MGKLRRGGSKDPTGGRVWWPGSGQAPIPCALLKQAEALGGGAPPALQLSGKDRTTSTVLPAWLVQVTPEAEGWLAKPQLTPGSMGLIASHPWETFGFATLVVHRRRKSFVAWGDLAWGLQGPRVPEQPSSTSWGLAPTS